MERRSFVLIGLMVLAGACFPVGSARAQEDAEGGARAQEDVEGLDGLTKTSVRDSIQGPDINVTDGGQKAPVNLRDVWILQNRLSGEDVDDILGQTRTLIDTDGSFGPIANTGIHSELGRQLSVLMKAREDVFTSDKSVDGMFDDLFGSSTGSASSSSTPSVAHLEELIESYKVPEAKRFTNCFCRVCGGRVPRYVKETDSIVIPAGSLDSDPPIHPQARIFWDSRASWSCDGDSLPVHSEYPTC